MTSFELLHQFDNERGRNDRFTYSRVMQNGKELFYKQARSAEFSENLVREKLWADFMESVAAAFPNENLRGPIFDHFEGNDGIMMEYVDAPHLADHRDLDSWRRNMIRYARMLYVLDQAAEEWSDVLSSVTPDYTDHRTKKFFKVWERWLGDNKSRVTRLDEARVLVEEYEGMTSVRMQHGDLTPWQIFDNEGTWVVYDGEKSGTDLLRYNDLAYGYGRLFTVLRSPESAAQLLNEYIKVSKVNEEQFAKQFLLVMTGRAVGMLSDALRDRDTDDYVQGAVLLLDLCLDRDLSHLR